MRGSGWYPWSARLHGEALIDIRRLQKSEDRIRQVEARSDDRQSGGTSPEGPVRRALFASSDAGHPVHRTQRLRLRLWLNQLDHPGRGGANRRALVLATRSAALGLRGGLRLACAVLAKTSGCDVALVDLPLSGLRIAAQRAVTDRIAGICWVAVADAAGLRFRDASFDALSHSDVCKPAGG